MFYKIIFVILIATFELVATELNSTEANTNKNYELIIKGFEHLDKDELAKKLGVIQENFYTLFNKKNILPQEFVESLDTSLKSYLESKGYFDAKFNIEKQEHKIVIDIAEGEPIRVISIAKESDYSALLSIINWQKGDIFASERFDKIKETIKKMLLEKGYCHSTIDSKAYVDLVKHSAKLRYKIKKGDICHFGKATVIHKPNDIDSKVIFSRLKYYEGERYNPHKIEESYNALNSLGVFGNIQIKDYLKDSNSTLVQTEISLNKRKKLRHYMLSLGYDSEIGLRFKGSWEKRNFLRGAQKIKIKSEISKKYKALEVTFFKPALLNYQNIYSDFYFIAGASKENRDAFKEKKFYLNSYLESYYKNFTIQKGTGLEILDIKLFQYYPTKIGGRFNLLYPYVNINYDTRDSKIDPKNGFYANLYSEFGVSNRGDAVAYAKYLVELRAIKTFNNITFSAVGKIGTIHEITGHLPASKLFYGGGLFSNRAYGKNDIGYLFTNRNFSPLGGKSYVNLQLESNFHIYKKLYGALFVDSTMISSKEYQFGGHHINSVGFGLRYKTPIGPVKIDFGFNMHKFKDNAISIMLGQSF